MMGMRVRRFDFWDWMGLFLARGVFEKGKANFSKRRRGRSIKLKE